MDKIKRVERIESLKVMSIYTKDGTTQRQNADVTTKAGPEIIHMCRKGIFAVINTDKVHEPMNKMKMKHTNLAS